MIMIQQSTPPLNRQSADHDDPTSKIQRTRYGKICLSCVCAPDNRRNGFSYGPNNIDRCLYLFDLDAEISCSSSDDAPITRRYPDLYLDALSLGFHSFCLLGSTLYLFGEWKRDVFSHELTAATTPRSSSSPTTKPQLLSADLLVDTQCPMKFPKLHPLGCQTPDRRRMLVFSTMLYVNNKGNRNFELFVPREGGGGGEWRLLPELVPLLRKFWVEACEMGTYKYIVEFVQVQSYAFIDNGPDLLIVTEVGNFTLNIENPLDWKPWREDVQVPHTDYETCMLVRDGLWFKDWFAWRVEDSPDLLLSYPDLSAVRYCSHADGSGVIWLQQPDCFCVARSLIERDGTTVRLIIDVCNFDECAYQSNSENIPLEDDDGKDESVVPGVKVVKRLEFVVERQIKSMCHHFFIRSLFPIPP